MTRRIVSLPEKIEWMKRKETFDAEGQKPKASCLMRLYSLTVHAWFILLLRMMMVKQHSMVIVLNSSNAKGVRHTRCNVYYTVFIAFAASIKWFGADSLRVHNILKMLIHDIRPRHRIFFVFNFSLCACVCLLWVETGPRTLFNGHAINIAIEPFIPCFCYSVISIFLPLVFTNSIMLGYRTYWKTMSFASNLHEYDRKHMHRYKYNEVRYGFSNFFLSLSSSR